MLVYDFRKTAPFLQPLKTDQKVYLDVSDWEFAGFLLSFTGFKNYLYEYLYNHEKFNAPRCNNYAQSFK